jgi:orotate phosphoribosyltransferase
MSPDEVLGRLEVHRGHFRYESGHHADLWIDLERLFLDPERIRPMAAELARRLAVHEPEAVCGPLVEGAFVAMMVASELGVAFTYAARFPEGREGLFPVDYRVPEPQRDVLSGRRVAIVNDVVSAGSAVRGTLADLRALGAQAMALGTLLVVGDSAPGFAADNGLALETLATIPSTLWPPAACPLCAAGVPLEIRGDQVPAGEA